MDSSYQLGTELGLRRHRWLIRARTLLCPPQERTHQEGYQVDLGLSSSELLRNAVGHLRRHGALPLFGLMVLAVGTALFGFTSSRPLADIVQVVVAIGVIVMLIEVVPRYSPVLDGCTFTTTGGAPPARTEGPLPVLLGAVGVLLLVSAATFRIERPLFDVPTLGGTAICGGGALLLAVSVQLTRRRWVSFALSVIAGGTALTCVADVLWAVMGATRGLDFTAAVLTAAGAGTYTVGHRALARLYDPRRDGEGVEGAR